MVNDRENRKTIHSLKNKEHLKKEMRISEENISKVNEILEENPLEAIKFLIEV